MHRTRLYCYAARRRIDRVKPFFDHDSSKMRRPLGPVTPGRVDTPDEGFLLDDLLDLVSGGNDDDDFLEGLMDTFTTGQLEQIASSMDVAAPAPAPPPPKRKKKKTSGIKHSDAFKKVRAMR